MQKGMLHLVLWPYFLDFVLNMGEVGPAAIKNNNAKRNATPCALALPLDFKLKMGEVGPAVVKNNNAKRNATPYALALGP